MILYTKLLCLFSFPSKNKERRKVTFMKNWTRFFSLLLALVCVAGTLIACQPKQPDETPSATPTTTPSETPKPEDPERFLTLVDGAATSYTIIRPSETTTAVKNAGKKMREGLRAYVKDVTLTEDFLMKDQQPGTYEILIGQTNREESIEALKGANYDDVIVAVTGDKLVINSYNDEKLLPAVEKVLASLKSENGKVLLSSKAAFEERATYPFPDLALNGHLLKDYRIVVPAAPHALVKNAAERLQKAIIAACGTCLPIVNDHSEATEKEIVIGKNERPASSIIDLDNLSDYTCVIKNSGAALVVGATDNSFALSQALDALTKMVAAGKIEEKTITLDNCITPMLTAFCFTDVHNCFAMLEPPYVFRKTATLAIDTLLATTGQVDIVLDGGDLMSDYPSWTTSGHLPYEYFLGFKELTVKTYAALAKDGKVMYVAGNHDYAQGEEATDGPGKNGSYNSADFYFSGPMKDTLGELPDSEKHEIVGRHTGEKYLLAFHYVVNGVDFIGLAPDPDLIWSNQQWAFNQDSMRWLKNKLNEIDPDGIKPIFMVCHYATDQRDARYEDVNQGIHHDSSVVLSLLPVLKGHRNLFYLYGHWTCAHSFHTDYTVKNVLHYNDKGNVIDIRGNETQSTEVVPVEKRFFTAVWMGGFRLDYNKEDFNNDALFGYGGYTKKQFFPTTATPKLSQGMYIEVFPDRVVFTMKNFGTKKGFETGTQLEPYTVYLYR